MISLNKRQSGFTIVELLIVIVVIGILATLVIVTFTGIQQKARDSQRQTDVNALNSQLEAYYAQNGTYPLLSQVQDPSWVKTNMKGLDAASLTDPKTPAADVTATATGIKGTADATHYGYDTSSATCDTNGCDGYKVTADLEAGTGQTFSKQSNT